MEFLDIMNHEIQHSNPDVPHPIPIHHRLPQVLVLMVDQKEREREEAPFDRFSQLARV